MPILSPGWPKPKHTQNQLYLKKRYLLPLLDQSQLNNIRLIQSPAEYASAPAWEYVVTWAVIGRYQNSTLKQRRPLWSQLPSYVVADSDFSSQETQGLSSPPRQFSWSCWHTLQRTEAGLDKVSFTVTSSWDSDRICLCMVATITEEDKDSTQRLLRCHQYSEARLWMFFVDLGSKVLVFFSFLGK